MTHTMQSSLFGELEYQNSEVYRFEQGIPAFPEVQEFIFIKVEDSPFTVMHSVKTDLYFFLLNPFTIVSDYEFAVPEHTIEQLGITDKEQVLCHSIAVLREPLANSTVNMAAPIILNKATHKGIQLVLESSKYSVRHPIFLNEGKEGYNNNENASVKQVEADATQQR